MITPVTLHYETAVALGQADPDKIDTITIPVAKRHLESLLRGLGWTDTGGGYWRHPDAACVHGDSSVNLQRAIEIVVLSIAIANAG